MACVCLDARAVLGPSGLHRYCEGLIPELAAQAPSHQFIVVRLRRAASIAFSSAPNVREVLVDGVTGTVPLLMSRGCLGQVFGLTGRPDLLHSLFHVLPFRVRRLQSAPPKIVVTLHDLIWVDYARLVEPTMLHAWWRRLLGATAIQHALETADHVVCNSEATLQAARRWIDRDRCTVVHHGVADTFRNGDELDDARCRRPPSVAAFGVPKAYKNIPCLVRAFAALAAKRPDLRLVLLGGDGGARAEINRLGLADRVAVGEGLTDAQVRTEIRRATAFVVPSLVEGFGLPALEAMALGTPLIVSGTPALREVTADAALTFIPTDPASLAAAIATILDNEPLRRELASRGCARAAGFRWSQCAQRTLAVYERVLGTPLRDASE